MMGLYANYPIAESVAYIIVVNPMAKLVTAVNVDKSSKGF